ncbi:MAG: hypothetical protein ACLPX5_12500 [Dissulfurispiraceae bacterium]
MNSLPVDLPLPSTAYVDDVVAYVVQANASPWSPLSDDDDEVARRRRELFTLAQGLCEEANSIACNLRAKTTLDPISIELAQWVHSVSLPKKWSDEGIYPPTIDCKNLTRTIVTKLYENYSLYPVRISASVEEGIFLKYLNHSTKRELDIEIYNDFDIAAIITTDKEIIESLDIADESFEMAYTIFSKL